MLSLVMPVHVPPDGEQLVHACLDSLEPHGPYLTQRIFVINGPCDERLKKRITEWSTCTISRKHPLGFTKAFNLGLAMAHGDVIQLNSDTVVPTYWLTGLVSDSAMIRGVLCTSDNHRSFPPGIHRGRAWGTCFYLPSYVRNVVGPWDERLNVRYSDQDYWIRCQRAGFDVAVTGNVGVWHKNSASFRSLPQFHQHAKAEKLEMIRRWGTSSYERWKNTVDNGRETIEE